MGRAYYRLFISFLVLVIVPMLAFGIFAYNISVLSIQQEAIKFNKTLLDVYKEKIDGILNEIDASFIQNGLVIETFDGVNLPSSTGDYLAQKKLMNINQFVTHLTANSSVIDDVVIYYKHDKVFITSNGRFDEKGFKNEDVAFQLKNNNANVLWLGPRWTKSKRSGRIIPVISYVRQLPLLSDYKKAAFIVDIDLYSLSSMMEYYENNYENQRLYLLDSNGGVVAAANKQLIGKDLSVYSYISQILSKEEGNEFRDNINGEPSIISFLPSSIPGWKYVIVTPIQSLMSGSMLIRRGIVVVTMFFIVMGIVISLLMSKRLYKPVKSIILSWQGNNYINRKIDEYAVINNYLSTLQHRNKDLEKRWKNIWPVVKDKILLDILKGRNVIGNNIADDLSSYGINIKFDNFVTLAAEIDDMKNMSNIDKEVFLFSVKNVVEEIINTEYKGFVTSEDYTVVFVVNLPQAEYYLDYKRTVRYLCFEIMDSIKKYMGFTISIGVSRLYHKTDELGKSYLEAVEAIKYRLLYGKHSVIFIEDVEPASEGVNSYPYDKEKELVMYIKAMDVKRVSMILDDIVTYLKNKSCNYIRQFFIQLVGYIMISIYDMGYTESELFEGRFLYGELDSLETLKDIRQWMECLCRDIITFLEYKHKEESKDIVIKCKNYIDEHFSDPEISLSVVAEKLYTSDSYLSRVFKEEVGMTFTEYLTLKRIERAKQLLEFTDMTMKEIAKNIGLSLQSFMRVFKKYEQMSPGQFRAIKRK
ncbi:helix-turn-helix domain-containing protein [Caldicoprobacter faecalis]|uniref:AraC-type DNA-binding protein n=1 Tax=Caldicoprobacter faecalis TaxID=937334 RepID=A0A1I5UP18_9FIRM|nr:helix-turn-helix domain-containing protein [Caldicoprobacter faecalis]SFP97054.1 AraC-type DNA-binding protein [Caldicoprobacter faecalis]